jgi:hypothetical protein
MRRASLVPLQELRDQALERTLVTHVNEAVFRDAWGTELELSAHDATEREDWWGQWGYMIGIGRKVSKGLQVTILRGNTVTSSSQYYI